MPSEPQLAPSRLVYAGGEGGDVKHAQAHVEQLPSSLLRRLPDPGVEIRGGVVALHCSSLPLREQPIFDHLAAALTPAGFAVASFDRRPAPYGEDTLLSVQGGPGSRLPRGTMWLMRILAIIGAVVVVLVVLMVLF